MRDQDSIINCPSCGSPITLGETSGTCSYCGTAVARRTGAPPVVVSRGGANRSGRATARRGGCGCIAVILVATLLFVGAIVAVTTLSMRQIRSVLGLGSQGWSLFRSERISDLLQVVPRDAAGDDIVVLLRNGDETTLGLLDSSGQTLRWQSTPLSKDAAQGAVALGPDAVYLADQTRLSALRLADGTPAWQVALNVELPPSCDECLLVLDDRVITLQKDRTMQAFEVQGGRPVWSVRLDSMPQRLPVIDGKLAVVQPIEGESGQEIQLIDPADGSVAARITPICESADETHHTANFYSSSLFMPSPDGAALFTLFGSPDDCAQRWDLGTGAPAWQTWLEDDIAPSSWDAQDVLLADGHLFIAGDGVLSALDTTSGDVTTLVRNDEYHMTPLFARAGIVVVKAEPDWDSDRHSLWGLDATTGERRWEYAVQAEDWFGESGFNDWGAQLTPAGVAVVQVPEDSRDLIVERLDLQTGASLGKQVTKIEGDGSPVVWENHWTDRMAWLMVDNTLFSIDLVSGATTAQSR